jgi:hypothetical protein
MAILHQDAFATLSFPFSKISCRLDAGATAIVPLYFSLRDSHIELLLMRLAHLVNAQPSSID